MVEETEDEQAHCWVGLTFELRLKSRETVRRRWGQDELRRGEVKLELPVPRKTSVLDFSVPSPDWRTQKLRDDFIANLKTLHG